ncbi:MAG: flagellar basal body-associated FliL family protein [Smithellaceae bacterium]
MCDVAVDVADNQNMQELEKNADIRKVIYRVAQTRTSVSLRSVEERKKLKIEMADEIKKLLGDDSVKNVYFTNYFIM